MEKDCLDKKFIAFKTADELKVHRMHVHDRNINKKRHTDRDNNEQTRKKINKQTEM